MGEDIWSVWCIVNLTARLFWPNVLTNFGTTLNEVSTDEVLCQYAFSGALGSFISQILLQTEKSLKHINWRHVAAYAGAGFVFIGPSVHYFHTWLDKVVPRGTSNMALKRLLLDRILFSPNFLLAYLYILAVFEGQGHKGAVQRIKFAYIPALMINYKVWTVLQYLNVKFIPADYRSPFMALMGLLFTIYIAMKQRS